MPPLAFAGVFLVSEMSALGIQSFRFIPTPPDETAEIVRLASSKLAQLKWRQAISMKERSILDRFLLLENYHVATMAAFASQ